VLPEYEANPWLRDAPSVMKEKMRCSPDIRAKMPSSVLGQMLDSNMSHGSSGGAM
jgi:hypothetical protein